MTHTPRPGVKHKVTLSDTERSEVESKDEVSVTLSEPERSDGKSKGDGRRKKAHGVLNPSPILDTFRSKFDIF